MSVTDTVPIPSWATARHTPESVDHGKLCFLIRLAALYHNEKGSLDRLSRAIGRSPTTLTMVIKRGLVTAELAVAIEKEIGRELFPRELFRPDLFTIAE